MTILVSLFWDKLLKGLMTIFYKIWAYPVNSNLHTWISLTRKLQNAFKLRWLRHIPPNVSGQNVRANQRLANKTTQV